MTLTEALECDRGRLNPSKFSIGASSLAAFDLRSSPLVKLNEALQLGGSALSSELSSLESLSNKPGYLSRAVFVGLLLPAFLVVSVRARPFSSMVKMTEALCARGLVSEMGPKGVLPIRFSGDTV